VPAGIPYVPHADAALRSGEIERVMVVSKASVFLSRLTELFDGVSFLLERNPGPGSDANP
jgi:betaine reductase